MGNLMLVLPWLAGFFLIGLFLSVSDFGTLRSSVDDFRTDLDYRIHEFPKIFFDLQRL